MSAQAQSEGYTIQRSWPTWAAFVADTQRPASEAVKTARNNSMASRGTDDFFPKWTGTPNFESAVALALRGDHGLATRFSDVAGEATRRYAAQVTRQRLVYAEEGDTFDVARVLQGEPECWQRWQGVKVRTPRYIKLIVSASASGSVEADTITARGSLICAAATLLEKAGNRVAIDAVFGTQKCCNSNVYSICYIIPIKAYNQPLYMPRVAFALAHPAFLRRLIFSLMEQETGDIARYVVAKSYGIPYDFTVTSNDAHYWPCMCAGDGTYWNDDTWRDGQLRALLAKYGIKLAATPSSR